VSHLVASAERFEEVRKLARHLCNKHDNGRIYYELPGHRALRLSIYLFAKQTSESDTPHSSRHCRGAISRGVARRSLPPSARACSGPAILCAHDIWCVRLHLPTALPHRSGGRTRRSQAEAEVQPKRACLQPRQPPQCRGARLPAGACGQCAHCVRIEMLTMRACAAVRRHGGCPPRRRPHARARTHSGPTACDPPAH
jgi:hypothetical protein